MRSVLIAAAIFVGGLVWGQEAPKVWKTEFTTEVLAQKITNAEGKKVSIESVINQHKGKVLMIDFWASWCKDCILALPKTKELIQNEPEVHFVYFSLDRSEAQWKKGLEKYGISEKENYWFDEGWKNTFNNYIELNWVPRFLLVDREGKIAYYYAISPEDPQLNDKIAALKVKQ